jgi:hypothetical protein
MGGSAGLGGGGGGGGAAGHIRHVGNLSGYEEGWVEKTRKTIEAELITRGIAPPMAKEIAEKIEEPSHVMPVIIGILATALILTVVFFFFWENT